jgi:hypothetical protein
MPLFFGGFCILVRSPIARSLYWVGGRDHTF